MLTCSRCPRERRKVWNPFNTRCRDAVSRCGVPSKGSVPSFRRDPRPLLLASDATAVVVIVIVVVDGLIIVVV